MTCDRAPSGWHCTRTALHDGPCAARPRRGMRLRMLLAYLSGTR